ncbi:MAG: AI-2 transport protein TqsA [Brevundimonas sp.]
MIDAQRAGADKGDMKAPITLTGSSVSRNALVILAVVAAGAAIYWLSDILTPLAMAFFLLIMIDGVRRAIERRTGLGTGLSMTAAVTLVLLGFIASIWIIVDGAASFIAQATGVVERLDAIIADMAGLVGIEVAPTARELIGEIDLRGLLADVAMDIQNIATGAFFVLIYLGFLIASQVGFKKKIVNMFPRRHDRQEAMEVFERVRGGVEGYLWVQTVTGAMICAVAYVLMRAVGLENAGFWTFVIFIVGYIPILGGAIAGLAPPLFALVQFETYWQAVVLLAGLQALLFIMGNVIQPRMQGDNQNIDPVVVLLSLAFWGQIWGVVGMFLSTPLAVAAMAILAEFKGSRWIAILLSGDGEPYAEDHREHDEKPAKTSLLDRLRRKDAGGDTAT